jgi:hypothetical protein
VYVFKEGKNGAVELNPNTLLIEGSLIVPVPEGVTEFHCELGLCPLEQENYKITSGLGSRKSVIYWASKVYSVFN